MSRVLIAAPIGGKKQYSINEWFEWIANQDYTNYDICLCTNGTDQEELIEKLNQVEIIDKHGIERKIIVLSLKNSDDLTVIQKITYAREKIRRYAVKNNYEYLFFLDTDTIPFHKDIIHRLELRNKDCISGLYFYKNSKVPVVIDKDTLTNISVEKCQKAADRNEIIEVWGFGFGVLLLSRKAFENPFDYDLFEEQMSDDFGYCQVLENAGIKRFLDPYMICVHLQENKIPDVSIGSNLAIPIIAAKRIINEETNNKDGAEKRTTEISDKNLDRSKD